MTAPQDPFSTPPQGPGGEAGGGGQPPTGGQPGGYGSPAGEPAGFGQQQPAYGQPAYGQPAYGAPAGPAKNGFGVAALVLGILSLPGALFVVPGILFGVLAIIFGFLGRSRAKRREATNGGMALAGLILGVLGLVLSVVLAAAVGSLLSRGDFGSLTECLESAGNDQAAIDECSREFEDSITG